jgi:DNA-binding transcriptional ArsR family regulator
LADDRIGAVFAALADPTRRAIAERLSEGEASVSELAEPFDVTLPAILKHLRVLEQAGMLEDRKAGRVRYCRLVPGALDDAEQWLSYYQRFWRQRFAGLRKHLDERSGDE